MTNIVLSGKKTNTQGLVGYIPTILTEADLAIGKSLSLLLSWFANHQSRHHTTNKMDCQPGGCTLPLKSSSDGVGRVCRYVCMG